jgi:response regulator RpfG family c-di-GMP phosphodiesterase
MHKILLVDDDENILLGYKRNLRNEFQVLTAESAKAGFQVIKENLDLTVIVSDYNMPEMNGIDFLSQVKAQLPLISRILLTGNAELQMAIEALNSGSIFRFLTKPCSQELLQNIIWRGIDQYKLLNAETELLDKTLKGSIKTMIDILAVTSPSIFNRSILIREYAKKILKRLKIAESWEIDIACLLSQIGCVGLPNEILNKKLKGISLTTEEEEMYYSQAGTGKSLLKNIPRLEKIADAIALQYKSFDDINLLKDEISDETFILIPKLLRLLNDYFLLVEKGIEAKKKIDILIEDKFFYDPLLFSALQAELLDA